MEYKRISDICRPKQWKTLSGKEFLNDGFYDVYGANGIIGKFNEYNHENETVIVGCRGTCGADSVRITHKKAYINGNAMCFDDLNREVNISYFYYFLKSLDYSKIITGIAQPQITGKSLENVLIPIPSFDIQNKIVSILDKITSNIDLCYKEIKLLDELIKSRFIEMFGRINDSKYDISEIVDLCEFVKDGTHQTPTYTDDTINGYKFLSSKDVTSGKIDWSNIKFIPEELHEKLYKTIKPQRNDILLAKNGTTGTAALVETDDVFDIYVSLAILRFRQGNNPKYMLYAINNDETKEQFNGSLKGVGVPNLHLGEIKKTKLIVPPIELQNKFVEFIEQIDKSKFIVQKRINLYKELLDKKMNEFFE